jgi:hypothetical protein
VLFTATDSLLMEHLRGATGRMHNAKTELYKVYTDHRSDGASLHTVSSNEDESCELSPSHYAFNLVQLVRESVRRLFGEQAQVRIYHHI